MSTISTNMNLVIPSVGSTPGPQWASDLNSSLTLVDQHDHTPGKGVPITPLGLSINGDLTFQSNNATTLRSARFASQSMPLALPTDVGAVYVSGADLYYNDTAGNQVRITQGGSIVGTAGSISGLPSGTASASYSAGTFTWQAATNTPASMNQGPTTVREAVLNGNGATLKTVNSLASNYDLILPTLPSSQKIMTLDASGNITAPYVVDGSTIDISSNTIRVAPGGITNTQLALLSVATGNIQDLAIIGTKLATDSVSNPKIVAGAVTPDKLSTAVFGSNGGTSAVTNAQTYPVTIGGSLRPVIILVSQRTAFGITASTTTDLVVYKGGSAFQVVAQFSGSSTLQTVVIVDTVGASGGTTYDLRTSVGGATLTPSGTLSITVYQL